MKVAVLLATFNKNDCLPNTLWSLSRQKTSFPVEVCIVDDCSDIDPKLIIEQFLPGAKYKRLDKHVGTQFSQSRCLDMVSSDTDVVVIQSADVMCIQDDVLERLCKGLDGYADGYFSMAQVRNISVPPDYWRAPEDGFERLRAMYGAVQGTNIYSGSRRPSGDWLLFLGAMTKADAYKINFDYRCCDIVVQHRLKEEGVQPIFADYLWAIHQHHPWTHKWPCSIVDSCEYWCSRKMF